MPTGKVLCWIKNSSSNYLIIKRLIMSGPTNSTSSAGQSGQGSWDDMVAQFDSIQNPADESAPISSAKAIAQPPSVPMPPAAHTSISMTVNPAAADPGKLNEAALKGVENLTKLQVTSRKTEDSVKSSKIKQFFIDILETMKKNPKLTAALIGCIALAIAFPPATGLLIAASVLWAFNAALITLYLVLDARAVNLQKISQEKELQLQKMNQEKELQSMIDGGYRKCTDPTELRIGDKVYIPNPIGNQTRKKGTIVSGPAIDPSRDIIGEKAIGLPLPSGATSTFILVNFGGITQSYTMLEMKEAYILSQSSNQERSQRS